jgi:hypothetical protein
MIKSDWSAFDQSTFHMHAGDRDQSFHAICIYVDTIRDVTINVEDWRKLGENEV